MKKIWQAVITLLVASTQTVCADVFMYSQKTYLSTRPTSANAANHYALWHSQTSVPFTPYSHSLQATYFYQQSLDEAALGQYFGAGNNKNTFTVSNAGDATINNGYLIHDTSSARTLGGEVTFKPQTKSMGVTIDYLHTIPSTNIFFQLHMPITYMTNSMQLSVNKSTLPTPADLQFSLEQFFAGNVLVPKGSANAQKQLEKLKIKGEQKAGGIADVKLSAGYKVLNDDSRYLFASGHVICPTGNHASGEYLFEPIYGNNGRAGIGTTIDFGLPLWQNEKACINLTNSLRYTYLFHNTQIRTPGLTSKPLSAYYLLGQINTKDEQLLPASNVVTQPFLISGASQLEGLFNLSFECCNWTIDVGYNIYWQHKETASKKQDLPENRYALAKHGFDTKTEFKVTDAENGAALRWADLDISSIETPGVLTHKIMGGIGYTHILDNDTFIFAGFGGGYEAGTSNADIERSELWAKAGLSF